MAAKLALVTGGNRGIGLELVRQLTNEGWTVYLAARSFDKAEEAARAFHGATPLHLDVLNHESIEAAARRVALDSGYLDLLINNAGILTDRDSALATKIENLRKTFEVNTLGVLKVTQAFAELLKKSRAGQVINVSSGMGQLSEMGAGAASYRISKTGLNALTRILAHDFAPANVSVNCICPGWVRTDMGGASASLDVAESVSKILPLIHDPKRPSGGFFRHSRAIPW